jgi:hypothetical protein
MHQPAVRDLVSITLRGAVPVSNGTTGIEIDPPTAADLRRLRDVLQTLNGTREQVIQAIRSIPEVGPQIADMLSAIPISREPTKAEDPGPVHTNMVITPDTPISSGGRQADIPPVRFPNSVLVQTAPTHQGQLHQVDSNRLNRNADHWIALSRALRALDTPSLQPLQQALSRCDAQAEASENRIRTEVDLIIATDTDEIYRFVRGLQVQLRDASLGLQEMFMNHLSFHRIAPAAEERWTEEEHRLLKDVLSHIIGTCVSFFTARKIFDGPEKTLSDTVQLAVLHSALEGTIVAYLARRYPGLFHPAVQGSATATVATRTETAQCRNEQAALTTRIVGALGDVGQLIDEFCRLNAMHMQAYPTVPGMVRREALRWQDGMRRLAALIDAGHANTQPARAGKKFYPDKPSPMVRYFSVGDDGHTEVTYNPALLQSIGITRHGPHEEVGVSLNVGGEPAHSPSMHIPLHLLVGRAAPAVRIAEKLATHANGCLRSLDKACEEASLKPSWEFLAGEQIVMLSLPAQPGSDAPGRKLFALPRSMDARCPTDEHVRRVQDPDVMVREALARGQITVTDQILVELSQRDTSEKIEEASVDEETHERDSAELRRRLRRHMSHDGRKTLWPISEVTAFFRLFGLEYLPLHDGERHAKLRRISDGVEHAFNSGPNKEREIHSRYLCDKLEFFGLTQAVVDWYEAQHAKKKPGNGNGNGGK